VGLSQPARGLGSLLGRRLYRRTRGALCAHFDTILRADVIDNQGRRRRGPCPLSSQGFSLDLYRFAIHHARCRQRRLCALDWGRINIEQTNKPHDAL
jgi:hypothetical protein